MVLLPVVKKAMLAVPTRKAAATPARRVGLSASSAIAAA